MKKLLKNIYTKPATELAPFLLGKYLCRKIEGEIIKLKITETECYFGESDTACHAHKGKTERTKILYLEGGAAYIYLCYGIHYLFNVVSGKKDFPEAVLIRGAEGYNGPGKLTKALLIDKYLNGEDLTASEKIWIEDDGKTCEYITAKRVGIEYATQEYKNKLWRFILKESSQ